MPTLDLAMPTALFIVITIAMFLNKRVEKKLVATVEQKEFKTVFFSSNMNGKMYLMKANS